MPRLRKTISPKQILDLIEEQSFRCALTGRDLTPQTASLDHKTPFSQGGVHDMDNIWVVDHRVNAAKGTMTAEEFIAMCREVVSHADAKLPTP